MGQDQSYGNQQASGDRKQNPATAGAKPSSDNQGRPGNPPKDAANTQDQNQMKAGKSQQPQPQAPGQQGGQQAQQQGQKQPMKDKLKEAFGRLSEDEIALYDSRKDQFFDKLQDKYGLAREEAEDRIHELEESQKAA